MSTKPFPTETQLRDAEQRLTEAERTGEAEALRELLAPDFAGHNPSGRATTRDSFIAALTSPTLRFERLEIDEVTCRIEGHTGIVCGRSDWTLHAGAPTVARTIVGSCRYLDIWQWRDERWQLLAAAVTPVAT